MRIFIEAEERTTNEATEEVAMLRHRISSIDYLKELSTEKKIEYAFKSEDSRKTYMMVENDSFEEIDKIIKRDPIYPFCNQSVSPVISSRQMVLEIQEFLGEEIIPEHELNHLLPRSFEIDMDGSYFMAAKKAKAQSPLISDEVHRDILRRTVLAQRFHQDSREMTDDNILGEPVGILIVKAETLEEVIEHVSRTEIYPDTKTDVFPLKTLEQSRDFTNSRFGELRPWIGTMDNMDNTNYSKGDK